MGPLFRTATVSVLLASLLSSAVALPILDERQANPPAAILPELVYYAQFSASAYCPNQTPAAQVVCADPYCPTVTANDVVTYAVWSDTTYTDTTGYVSVDKTKGRITVTYRGSVSVRNWITNINFDQVALSWCSGCMVHDGFLNAFNEVYTPILLPAVQTLVAQYPSYSIVVTGHSLGGALSQLTAIALRRAGYTNLKLYTYGSPRVGNLPFVQYADTWSASNYRVTHLNDAVPKLPPILAGYFHSSPEYHIFRGDIGITAADIKVWTGAVNLGGNTGTSGLNGTAHTWYLEKITGCGGGAFELK